MELFSAVLYLDVDDQQALPADSGPLVQGWFFSTLGKIQKALGADVHKNGGYSLSTITRDGNGVYVRIASLRQDLSEWLAQSLLPELNTINLASHPYQVKMALTSGHELAGQISYADLKLGTQGSSSLALHFASPTAFRANGMDLPLPTPYHVLYSWLRTWNQYAPPEQKIAYPLHLFAENCIAITALRSVETSHAAIPRGNRAVGFTGEAKFTMKPLAKCADWADLWKKARHDWQTLAAFALFAGTGQHTGCGMGQTRPAQLEQTREGDSQ